MSRVKTLVNTDCAWDGEDDPQRVAVYNPDIHAAVDARLGIFDGYELDTAGHEAKLKDAMSLLGPIWDFCFENGKGKLVTVHTSQTLRVVLRRFAVLTLMYRPNLMPHEKLRSLGPKLGVSRVPVSKIGLEAAARFGCQTRVQKPKDSIPNYTEAAKRGHKVRKLRAKLQPKMKLKPVAQKPKRKPSQH